MEGAAGRRRAGPRCRPVRRQGRWPAPRGRHAGAEAAAGAGAGAGSSSKGWGAKRTAAGWASCASSHWVQVGRGRPAPPAQAGGVAFSRRRPRSASMGGSSATPPTSGGAGPAGAVRRVHAAADCRFPQRCERQRDGVRPNRQRQDPHVRAKPHPTHPGASRQPRKQGCRAWLPLPRSSLWPGCLASGSWRPPPPPSSARACARGMAFPAGLLAVFDAYAALRKAGQAVVLTASAVELSMVEGNNDVLARAEVLAERKAAAAKATHAKGGAASIWVWRSGRPAAAAPPGWKSWCSRAGATAGRLRRAGDRNTAGTQMNGSSSRSHCFAF